jgi:triacylglycerol lipase
MLSASARARRRLILVVATMVVAAVVAAVFVAVAVSRPDATKPRVAPAPAPSQPVRPGPVLLVPGYGGATTGLQSLAQLLRRHGKDADVISLPGRGLGDLNGQARALGVAARAARERTHATSVDVIGYSAGGVVARLWVRSYGGAALARRVITLGAPHHGTDLARLAGSVLPGACPAACRQLEPGSRLLAALNAGDETPAGPTFVSIWTEHDEVVVPTDSAALSGALDLTVQSVCPRDAVGHGGLPTDHNVAAMIVSELGAGAPVPLSARDCGRVRS